MDKILVLIIIILLIGYYFKCKELKIEKDRADFMKWQAEEFSKLLENNKIFYEWG